MRRSPIMFFEKADVASKPVLISCQGYHTASLAISGIFVGTVRFWASLDGQELFEVQAVSLKNGLPLLGTTQRGLFRIDVSSLNFLGCDLTNWFSGAVTISGELSE